MATGLTWEGCKAELDEDVLAGVEQSLAVRFPSEFRAIVLSCQGGAPVERTRFQYRDPRIGPVFTSIGALLMIDPAESNSISETLAALAVDDQIPERVVPFAEIGNGDLVCFDFRAASDATDVPVVYWAHTKNKPDSVLPVASSFSAFLELLEPRAHLDT